MSARPLQGVRVLEVASHVFVPAGTAILAEWGAEVLKVEHPETGDPYRGLVTAGLHREFHGVDVNFSYANRSKESLGINLRTAAGRRTLLRLAADCQVFATSLREDTLRRLRLEPDDLRAVNDSIVYLRGTGYGAEGPDSGRGAYDHSAYWARSGTAYRLASPESGEPQPPPPAYGDYAGSLAVAAGISSALYRQATAGVGSVVDVSLLGTGMWQLQPDVIDGRLGPSESEPPGTDRRPDRFAVANPLVNNYATADGRHLMFVMVDSNRHWRNFCEVVGVPDMADDPRYCDGLVRADNSRSCVEALDGVFATRDLGDWCKVLQDLTGEWAPVLRPDEVPADPQVVASGFVVGAELGDGAELPMVVSPVRFDGETPEPRRAPEVGEHTEVTLARLGFDWAEIAELKEGGAII